MEPIEFYTRAHCNFSARLKHGLIREGIDFVEIDIWADAAASERVRAHARGYETVPTVRIGETWLVNPSVEAVAEAVAANAD